MNIAALQMVSTPDVLENIETARGLIQQAVGQGATMVLLPEYWAIMGMKEHDKVVCAELPGTGVIQKFMSEMARHHQIWLIGGTIPMQSTASEKIFNTVLVYGPDGQLMTRYDKIHLFGFTKGTESYNESQTIEPGHEVVTFDAPIGRVGLSVCYDVRFPELYRSMGPCILMVVPAAFTYTTGQVHWELLLRARAVENQCYVLAAAQGGQHQNGRRTWGHSMLVDPWGKIMSVLPEGEGVIAGTIDVEYVRSVRESLPALAHRRIIGFSLSLENEDS